jgi:hypothetical protein
MAATYTEVTLEEMETFLKRAFRALRPKQGSQNNEIYYDLAMSPVVAIRVWTSIKRSGSAAGVGEDAIRVQFLGTKVNRPLVSGKAPIVKRTQNWRNSLQDKIEEYLELYEEKAGYWDSRGGAEPSRDGPPPGPDVKEPAEPESSRGSPAGPLASDKQVNFIMIMAARSNEEQWKLIVGPRFHIEWPPSREAIRELTMRTASLLIDTLVRQGLNRRYASGGEVESAPSTALDPLRSAIRVAIASCGEDKCFGGEGCPGTSKTEACEGACKDSEGSCPCESLDYDFS